MINLSVVIIAYILTGGQSRRLNMDNSSIQIKGKTLTDIIYQRLDSVFENSYVVGKENHFPLLPFIYDIKLVQCPLNGIITALDHSDFDWIFVIACDLPLVEASIINELYDNIKSNTHVVLPIVDDDLQPLCAFYHKSLLKKFDAAIGKGDYSLMKLLKQIEVVKVTIPIEDEEQFLNINYQEDLKKAEELLKILN